MRANDLRLFFLVVIGLLSCCGPGWAVTLKETFQQAMEKFSLHDYAGAIRLYDQLLQTNPDFAPAYNFLGLAHKEKGEGLNDVVWYFKKAIDLDPNYADAYNNLGKIYYGLGQFDKAEEASRKALDLKPDMANAKLSLGWIYLLGKSKPREAISYFKDVVEGDDHIPYACFGLGMAYFMDHQKPLVLEMITKLRFMKEDDLAKKLEDMIRDNTYVPITQEGMPLVSPQRGMSTLVKDIPEPSSSNLSSQAVNQPVRLKSKRLSDEDEPEHTFEQINSSVQDNIEKVEAFKRQRASGMRSTSSISQPSSSGY